MATVIFYEKPGCGNNTKQKKLLTAAGHSVEARSILTEAWTAERLQQFFDDYSVPEWFNRAAPQVKSGAVIPEQVSAAQAIEMMLTEPLLIRRPLMQVGTEYRIGFDSAAVAAWIGLDTSPPETDLETCPRQHSQASCPNPTGDETL